ncbi:unnamed protein product, partial [Allacma fusca]
MPENFPKSLETPTPPIIVSKSAQLLITAYGTTES